MGYRAYTRPTELRETHVTRQVLDLADAYHWPLMLRYHTYRSTKSAPGFPDWIFVKPTQGANDGRLVAIETKGAGTRITAEQAVWIGALGTIPGCDAAIIGPGDLDVAARLLGPPRSAGC